MDERGENANGVPSLRRLLGGAAGDRAARRRDRGAAFAERPTWTSRRWRPRWRACARGRLLAGAGEGQSCAVGDRDPSTAREGRADERVVDGAVSPVLRRHVLRPARPACPAPGPIRASSRSVAPTCASRRSAAPSPRPQSTPSPTRAYLYPRRASHAAPRRRGAHRAHRPCRPPTRAAVPVGATRVAGTWRMARRWWRTALTEHHAVSPAALARAAARYVPELDPAMPARLGRRAGPGGRRDGRSWSTTSCSLVYERAARAQRSVPRRRPVGAAIARHIGGRGRPRALALDSRHWAARRFEGSRGSPSGVGRTRVGGHARPCRRAVRFRRRCPAPRRGRPPPPEPGLLGAAARVRDRHRRAAGDGDGPAPRRPVARDSAGRRLHAAPTARGGRPALR